jgi:hypothetical protein
LGLDLELTVGAQSQEVTVTAAPVLITDSGSQDTVLNQEMATQLPLSGNNIFLLATTVPGQTNGISGPLSNRPFDNGGEDSFSFNGAPGGNNNNAYLIDGMPDNNTEGMGFVPAPDAVSEVNIMTNQYDAESGRTAGGTVSVALKSGTNQYHGDAYWDLRTNHLNGNLFQNNRVGQKSQVTQWSVPGFQIGGPVQIPGVYNGRNKMFFSVSYEHFFDKVAESVSRTYPSISQMAGNFCSGAPGNQGQGRVIYDPTTTITDPTNPAYGTRTAFGGCPSGETGSIIPANRIDPLATALFKQLPGPNVPGCTNQYLSGCGTNYQSGKGQGDHYYSTTERVDYTASPTESFFVSYEAGNRLEFITNPGANASNKGYFPDYNTWRINHGAGFNLTSILSPTMVSTFAVSWLRNNGLGLGAPDGVPATTAGFDKGLTTLFGANNFPGYGSWFPNYLGQSGGGGRVTDLADYWTVQETLSKVRGAHSFKFGFLNTISTANDMSNSRIPTPGFSASFTENSPGATGTKPYDGKSGSDIASALLGYPSSMSFTNPLSISLITRYYAAFVQDNWRASRRLTLTMGLRWDIQTNPIERYNRIVTGFNAGTVSVGALANPCGPGACAANATNGVGGVYAGGLEFATPNQRGPYRSTYSNWAPRFGFAYQLGNKSVVRGGWGRFVDFAGALNFVPSRGNSKYSPGYQSTTSLTASPDSNFTPTLCANTPGCAAPAGNPEAGLSANGFASAFPNGLVPVSGSSLRAGTAVGNNIQFADPNWRPDYTDQFNLGYEIRLPSDMVLHVGYSGSRTYLMPVNVNINTITEAQYLSLGPTKQLTPRMANPFCNTAPVKGACPAGFLMYPGTSALGSGTVSVQQMLQPFPQYGSVTENAVPMGRSWYNSLQISLTKRMTHGLSFNSSYTWAHQISTGRQVNPYDPGSALLRAPAGVPWVLHFAGTWQLPWQGGSNYFTRAIAGGWNVSVIETFQVGSFIGTPGGVIWTGVNPMTPVGKFQGASRSPGAVTFNPCVADSTGTTIITSSVSAGCPANTPMNQVPWRQQPTTYVNTSPSQLNVTRLPRTPPNPDFTLYKSIPMGEQFRFAIKAEAYNLTNTPVFNGVTTSATSTSFGQVSFSQSNTPRTIQLTGQITF